MSPKDSNDYLDQRVWTVDSYRMEIEEETQEYIAECPTCKITYVTADFYRYCPLCGVPLCSRSVRFINFPRGTN